MHNRDPDTVWHSEPTMFYFFPSIIRPVWRSENNATESPQRSGRWYKIRGIPITFLHRHQYFSRWIMNGPYICLCSPRPTLWSWWRVHVYAAAIRRIPWQPERDGVEIKGRWRGRDVKRGEQRTKEEPKSFDLHLWEEKNSGCVPLRHTQRTVLLLHPACKKL